MLYKILLGCTVFFLQIGIMLYAHEADSQQHTPTTEITQCLYFRELLEFLEIFPEELYTFEKDGTIIFHAANGDMFWLWDSEKKRYCVLQGKDI